MSAKTADKPKVEYAKTGRASCRTCRQKIIKDECRIGIPYQFTRPNGEKITSYGFYHPDCVPRNKIESILEVLESVSTIESETREKVIESLKRRQKEGKKDSKSQESAKGKPFLEPSKSSRGTCRICEKKIEKGVFRLAIPSKVELENGRTFSSHKYHHVKCYLNTLSNAKPFFNDLLQESIRRKSISKSEAEDLEKNFQEDLSVDETAATVLALITEEPIEIKVLKRYAKKNGIPFNTIKKALKKGLLSGVYFEPSSGVIQKL